MRNNEFIKLYVTEKINGVKVNNHCAIHNNDFINYDTVICSINHDAKTAKLNIKKYSQTTTKIQNQLCYELKKHGYKISEYTGENCILFNFGYQGVPRFRLKDFKQA